MQVRANPYLYTGSGVSIYIQAPPDSCRSNGVGEHGRVDRGLQQHQGDQPWRIIWVVTTLETNARMR